MAKDPRGLFVQIIKKYSNCGTALLIALLSVGSASSYAQHDAPDLYIWTNNKNTQNESPGGEVAAGTYIEIGVYIAPSAKVLDSASVTGRARIYGNAIVRGQSSVEGNARIYGNAVVEGQATVSENAAVFGNALIGGDAIISGTAKITGQSQIRSGTVSSGLVDKKPSAAELEARNQAAATAVSLRQANEELYASLTQPIGELTVAIVAELNGYEALKKTSTHHRINYHFEKYDSCKIIMRKSAVYDGGYKNITSWVGENVSDGIYWTACLPGKYAMHITGENYGAIEFVGGQASFGNGSASFDLGFRIIYREGAQEKEGFDQLMKSLEDYKANVVALYEQIPNELKPRIGE